MLFGRTECLPDQFCTCNGLFFRAEATLVVCSSSNGQKNSLAVILTFRDVRPRFVSYSRNSSAGATYPTSGQFFRFVPSNVSHSLLMLARSYSGAPPGPLIVITNAMTMAYGNLSVESLESIDYQLTSIFSSRKTVSLCRIQ